MLREEGRPRRNTTGTVIATSVATSGILFLLAWQLCAVQKACQCPREAALQENGLARVTPSSTRPG